MQKAPWHVYWSTAKDNLQQHRGHLQVPENVSQGPRKEVQHWKSSSKWDWLLLPSTGTRSFTRSRTFLTRTRTFSSQIARISLHLFLSVRRKVSPYTRSTATLILWRVLNYSDWWNKGDINTSLKPVVSYSRWSTSPFLASYSHLYRRFVNTLFSWESFWNTHPKTTGTVAHCLTNTTVQKFGVGMNF